MYTRDSAPFPKYYVYHLQQSIVLISKKNKINNIYILNRNLKSHNSDLEMSNCVGFLSSIH